MDFRSRPLVAKTYQPEAFPPRRLGHIAAMNLGRGIEDNPYGTDPVPAGDPDPGITVTAGEPGHPYREWREGFIRGRMLLQKQNSANFAVGKGLVLMYRNAPADTLKTLCQIGKNGSEFIALALLVAAMDAYGLATDERDPLAVGVIYGVMQDRIHRRERGVCHSEEHEELAKAAYEVGEFLETVFQRRPSEITVACKIGSLKFALDRLVGLDVAENMDICQGPTDPAGEPECLFTGGMLAPFSAKGRYVGPPMARQPQPDPISHEPPPGPIVDPIEPT